MYHINRRTDEPLDTPAYPGRNKTTSRCQTPLLIWIIGGYQPVIPSVPFPMMIAFSTQKLFCHYDKQFLNFILIIIVRNY